MDSDSNFVGSFGDLYYRSADYRTRYPAYLRSVAPPPTMAVNVQDMLFPKQFALQKIVNITSNGAKKTSTEQSPAMKKPSDFKEMKTKRKLARKQRRSRRSKTPPQKNNARNDNSVPQMLTEDDHTQYPSDSISFHIQSTAVDADHEPLNQSSSTPTSPSFSTLPIPSPPPLPTASEEYYSSQHTFPLPPPPITEAEEHNGHQNQLILPDYPSPPSPQQPFKAPNVHLSVNDNNELLNPIEQFKRTTKRFQRECRRLRHLTTFQDEKFQARTIAEQAHDFVKAAKKGGFNDDNGNRKKHSGDESLIRKEWQDQNCELSDYAEMDRLGLGEYNGGSRWVPNSKNKLKEKLLHFR